MYISRRTDSRALSIAASIAGNSSSPVRYHVQRVAVPSANTNHCISKSAVWQWEYLLGIVSGQDLNLEEIFVLSEQCWAFEPLQERQPVILNPAVRDLLPD